MSFDVRLFVPIAFVVGCSVSDADPAFWDPSHDLGGGQIVGVGGEAGNTQSTGGAAGSVTASGGMAGTIATGGMPSTGGTSSGTGGGTNSGTCALHFQFTTVTYHGKYSPKNIGAVWIETAQGQFVKSLNVWAAKRINNLIKWKAASGGNKVDAVTAATASNHGPHAADWDCTDVNHQPVPDGPYRLRLEFTEEDSAQLIWPPGPSTAIDFTKGSPTQFPVTDLPNYVSMSLTLN
jgi:hypothetical protein